MAGDGVRWRLRTKTHTHTKASRESTLFHSHFTLMNYCSNWELRVELFHLMRYFTETWYASLRVNLFSTVFFLSFSCIGLDSIVSLPHTIRRVRWFQWTVAADHRLSNYSDGLPLLDASVDILDFIWVIIIIICVRMADLVMCRIATNLHLIYNLLWSILVFCGDACKSEYVPTADCADTFRQLAATPETTIPYTDWCMAVENRTHKYTHTHNSFAHSLHFLWVQSTRQLCVVFLR